jgi:glycosyltransferase involved in cell wall biosynthesis
VGLLKKLRHRRRPRHGRASCLPATGVAASPDIPRILFVSHEATRTGAPKIILNILRHFHQKTDAHLQTILHSGGFLAEEFGLYSEVDCLNLPREPSDELSRRIRKICMRHKDSPPMMAICNSMESRFIGYELQQLGIPVTFLIHELPSSYEVHDYQQVYDCSERIIFPVEVVRSAAHEKVSIPTGKCSVMPQGLLDPDFAGSLDRPTVRQQIRRELGLPDDAYIVLGCGTLDLRKGIDHFCGVARTLLRHPPPAFPVHFVWLGEGDRWAHTPYHYAMLDVQKSNIFQHVHFIGEREDVQPWFAGSDVFVLTSRVDPFPCVIHEAMAARLPVITFDSSGGAVECISDGAGLTVPYADYRAMSERILMLAENPSIAESIRNQAHARVHRQYRFDDYANKLIEFAEQTTRRRLVNVSLPAAENHVVDFPRAA